MSIIETHTHACIHVYWYTKKQKKKWRGMASSSMQRQRLEISHLINVYITVANVIQAHPCWEGSRSLGKPTWVDNRLCGSCVHSPVNWTHQEGLRGEERKKKIQLGTTACNRWSQSSWVIKLLENLLRNILAICSPHTDWYVKAQTTISYVNAGTQTWDWINFILFRVSGSNHSLLPSESTKWVFKGRCNLIAKNRES